MSFTILYLILGDFFLNDLIEAEDDENKCLVADVSKNTLIEVWSGQHCYNVII